MKILVDEKPATPSECLFGESDSWCETYCKIDGCARDIEKCLYLKEIGDNNV